MKSFTPFIQAIVFGICCLLANAFLRDADPAAPEHFKVILALLTFTTMGVFRTTNLMGCLLLAGAGMFLASFPFLWMQASL